MFDIEVVEGPSMPSIIGHMKKEDKTIGQFMLVPHSEYLYEAHVSPVLKQERGYTEDFARYGLKLVFKQMDKIQKIISFIPRNNILAKRLAENSGMIYECTIKESYFEDGRMIDLEVYGITREEVLRK